MLELRDARPGGHAPPPPDADDPAATVWREEDGTVVALGTTRAALHWLHLPRLGAFSFAGAGGGVTAMPEPGVPPELVADAFRRMVLPLALQAQGREVLHASAVRTDAGVIALCAVSGTGKSTLACALSERGHELWADDAVCVDLEATEVRALPLPFALRLRPASEVFFGTATANGSPRSPERPERLAGVFLLERSEQTRPQLARFAGPAAFATVLAHAYCFSMHDRERNAAMMRNYLELTSRTPMFRVTFPAGLEGIGDVVNLIERANEGLA